MTLRYVAVNKADRQLNDLMTNGVTIDTTGDEEADGKSASQAQRSLDTQVVICAMPVRML